MEKEKAKRYAASVLSSRMYTCKEVVDRLVRKGFDTELAEEVVGEFCAAGVLDDAEYARCYVHDAINIGMKGEYRIKQELLRKGVAGSVIDKALAEFEDDTEKQLEEYVQLRFGNTVFTDRRDIEKAKAHLARRGYSYTDIRRCFENLDIRVQKPDDDRGDWD